MLWRIHTFGIGRPCVASRPEKTASQPIDMLKKIAWHVLPEWVKNELSAFSTCKFRSRNEIGVASHENDNVRLAFQCDRSDIEPNTHVDTFLS